MWLVECVRMSHPSWTRSLLAGLAVLLAFVASATNVHAASRSYTVRWMPPESPDLAGYVLLVGNAPGSYQSEIDLGFHTPDNQGVASAGVFISADHDVYLALRAYNEADLLSVPSNEIVVAAPAPDPEPEPDPQPEPEPDPQPEPEPQPDPQPDPGPGPGPAPGPLAQVQLGTRAGMPGSIAGFDLDGTLSALPAPGVSGTSPSHVAWCDTENDGEPELVVGAGSGDRVLIYAVVDDEATLRRTLITRNVPGNGATHPGCGDFDGDGRDEIVVGLGDGWIQFYEDAGTLYAPMSGSGLSAGARRWTAWESYRARSGIARPAAGDLDGDGRDEIVIGLDQGGEGWIFLMDDASTGFAPWAGTGWYQWTTWAPFVAAGGASYPALGDLDRDGRDELVIGLGAGGSGWLMLLDDATSGFRPYGTQSGWLRAASAGTTHPAVGDLDGDGRVEIVVGSDGTTVRLFDDRLAPHPATPLGDGRIDVTLLGATGPFLPALRGAGPVAIEARTPARLALGNGSLGGIPDVDLAGAAVILGAASIAPDRDTRVAWCDFAGDGEPELAVGFDGGDEVRIFGVSGTTSALLVQLDTRDVGGAGSTTPGCGDIDGDGRDELVVGLEDGWIQVFEDASAGFAPATLPGLTGGATRWTNWAPYLAAGGAAEPALGDIDGDGRDEIVIGLGTGGEGWIFVMDDALADLAPWTAAGWVQWTGWAPYLATTGASHPALGDLDQDGRDEIVIGLGNGGEGWLMMLDDGLAGFAPYGSTFGWIQVPGTSDTTRPAVGDVDGDGRPEIVVGSEDPSELHVFEHDLVPHPGTPSGDGWLDLQPLALDGPVRPALSR